MKCINCNEPIEYWPVIGNSGFWVHPDKVDLGCHGTACDNEDETDAEPTETSNK
jgi:hypothetical protein